MYSNCFYLFIIFLAGSFLRVALWSAGILGLVAAEALLGRFEHGESGIGQLKLWKSEADLNGWIDGSYVPL